MLNEQGTRLNFLEENLLIESTQKLAQVGVGGEEKQSREGGRGGGGVTTLNYLVVENVLVEAKFCYFASG